ncbi:MAG: hypothetical protein ACFB0B_02550 [Thermonemataceae bacterium]
MENISLRKATIQDKALVVAFDYNLDKVEHIELKRAEKITKAILSEECFIISMDNSAIGFTLFDYRFFDQGWIELIVIDEKEQAYKPWILYVNKARRIKCLLQRTVLILECKKH